MELELKGGQERVELEIVLVTIRSQQFVMIGIARIGMQHGEVGDTGHRAVKHAVMVFVNASGSVMEVEIVMVNNMRNNTVI